MNTSSVGCADTFPSRGRWLAGGETDEVEKPNAGYAQCN